MKKTTDREWVNSKSEISPLLRIQISKQWPSDRFAARVENNLGNIAFVVKCARLPPSEKLNMYTHLDKYKFRFWSHQITKYSLQSVQGQNRGSLKN